VGKVGGFGRVDMFRGVQHINLDAKGRMAVPARQRELLSVLSDGQVVITVDTQSPCLALYALPEWERIERDVQALPALNPAIKRFQRLILGYASDLQLDGNGRVLLPPALREYAQLEKRSVLVGQGNKLELWSEELWLRECEAALMSDSDGELPAELMQLNL
jgi:MraZ protein